LTSEEPLRWPASANAGHRRPPALDDIDEPGTWDGVDLQALAHALGTPLHVYSAGAIRQRIASLRTALAGLDAAICYAVKANSNLAILRLMTEQGVGADIVSAGELRRCLQAGMPASRIVFSGVGKTEDELTEALAAGIGRFNIESADELASVQRLARARGVIAHAAVRINPDVDPGTHVKISTGRLETKFGVSIREARGWFAEQSRLTHVCLDGLHMHIGSQVLALEPFRHALERLAQLWRELAAAGHAITSIDVGGGLGVCYRAGRDQPVGTADYVDAVREALCGFSGRIVLEPGRWLVAEAGVLLTRVLRIKQGERCRFLVLDAAMNDLLRPSLYDAWHDLEPVLPTARPLTTYDIVGPVCESGDTFARAREMPECRPGDLLMFRSTGAYGAAMASTYNSRPLAAEVLADAGRYAVVRCRQSFEDMISGESMITTWQTT
jgi:diaminopimelate decarboxylase